MNGWKKAVKDILCGDDVLDHDTEGCPQWWLVLLRLAAEKAFMERIPHDDPRCELIRAAINHSAGTVLVPPDEDWSGE